MSYPVTHCGESPHCKHVTDGQERIAILEAAVARWIGQAREATERAERAERRLKALLSHPWAIGGPCDLRYHPKEYCVIETAWINSEDREEKAIAYGDTAEDAIDAAIEVYGTRLETK